MADTAVGRRWGSLTGELDLPGSLVKEFFAATLPNVRQVQRRYREAVGSLVVAGVHPAPGTVGAAFDWSVRFLLHPQPSLDLAAAGARRLVVKLGRPPGRLPHAVTELAARLGIGSTGTGLGVRNFDGPVPGSEVSQDVLLAGCWALALLVEQYRSPVLSLASPLSGLDLDTVNADTLLGLADSVAVAEVARLRDLAGERLLPELAGRRGEWALGPTFAGSQFLQADADVIGAGLLVELKTGLGRTARDGTRSCVLDATVLYQVLGYALLDFDDRYGLDSVAVYEARYGHLTTWNLPDLLDETAGRRIDLAGERDRLRRLLTA